MKDPRQKRLSKNIMGILLSTLMIAITACDGVQSAPSPSSSPTSSLGEQDHGTVIPLHTPEPAAVAHVAHANTAYKQGNYRQAVAEFDEAIQIDPNYEEAYADRGVSYFHLGELDSAVGDYTQAIKLDPNEASAFYNRGLAYEKMLASGNSLGYAIADFTRAITLKPNEPSYYDDRGVAYGRQRDYDKAIADYGKAIALAPDFISAYRNRALTYTYLSDYDNALKDISHVIGFQPSVASYYYERASVYEDLKDYARERMDLNKALTLSTDPQFTKGVQDLLAAIPER